MIGREEKAKLVDKDKDRNKDIDKDKDRKNEKPKHKDKRISQYCIAVKILQLKLFTKKILQVIIP